MSRLWKFGTICWEPQSLPRLMGIVNVTPDSFSDGGRWSTMEAAVEQGLKLISQGADVLDIGGESTRPGADPVGEAEELHRVIPVISRLVEQTGIPVSIDTTKAAVAREALAAGAVIVNDVSALTLDPDMPAACAGSDCGVILMHMSGTPKTMQQMAVYGDVVTDVRDYLSDRLARLSSEGINAERMMIDPGIGFGKRSAHNLQLLSRLSELQSLGRPVLIGHSRKAFLGRILGREVDERLAGTVGISIALAEQGADLLRVHDVGAVRDALLSWHAIRGGSGEGHNKSGAKNP